MTIKAHTALIVYRSSVLISFITFGTGKDFSIDFCCVCDQSFIFHCNIINQPSSFYINGFHYFFATSILYTFSRKD